MPPTNSRSNPSLQESVGNLRPSMAFVVMIFGALIAFEIFNYSTTEHALADLLGNLTFASIPWSTVLAIAFCGIDFAGIARLFTPEQGQDEPKEVWYLFGAWLLAATMNAILTWWGVSMAVANHTVQSSTVVDPQTITSVVPVFVAIMVWVIRILIIGTLSLAMDRILHPEADQRQRTAIQNAVASGSSMRTSRTQTQSQPMSIPTTLGPTVIPTRPAVSRAAQASSGRASRFSAPAAEEPEYVNDPAMGRGRPDPTYHSLAMSARPQVNRTNGSSSGDNNTANHYQRS